MTTTAAPETIAFTIVKGREGTAYRVSTIKIRDESYETMVFPGEPTAPAGFREVDVQRTDSRRAAHAAHDELVNKWTAGAGAERTKVTAPAPFNYEASQLNRLTAADTYRLQIISDDGAQSATKWLTITPAQLAAIRVILAGE
jgi:maltooligosyltrehalose synthase